MPKYGRILTKKAFIKHIGQDSKTTYIDVDNLSDSNAELLDNIGITKHVNKRLEFLDWLSDHIENKKNHVASSNVEDWL